MLHPLRWALGVLLSAVQGSLYYGWRLLRLVSIVLIVSVGVLFLCNALFFSSYVDTPSRTLSPDSASCRDAIQPGWDVMAATNNDEWAAVDKDKTWQRKLGCSIQRHILPGFVNNAGEAKDLSYDLAFLEFQEDGKPYALRIECGTNELCDTEREISVKRQDKGQLEGLLSHLKKNESNYVVVFIHGWRHDASIGDKDVAKFRIYAAHAARFVADRVGRDSKFTNPKVTAVFIGWRGARTDENWLSRQLGEVGRAIGTVSAILTLFDRKPVSEAIAPSVLAALRTIERSLNIDTYASLPPKSPNRMIIFGHSLGGNLLMTALQDHLEKKATNHVSRSYMLPALGDLVVLINPASEASKWTSVQRMLWRRMALVYGERRPGGEYEASHRFFRDDQRPIIISATAARNWPPGGRQQLDCAAIEKTQDVESQIVQSKGIQYDWATHDMFPAFKFDLRPLADRIEQMGTGIDPNDECLREKIALGDALFSPVKALAAGIGAILRVIPFMQTDPEETRTIGNLDPPRSPAGNVKNYGTTMKPFGTTHELRKSDRREQFGERKRDKNQDFKEIPLTYNEIMTKEAGCPTATGWLSRVRHARKVGEAGSRVNRRSPYSTGWDTLDLRGDDKGGYPALRFIHGFDLGGIAPPTRPNDPFWNLRAFDTALAAHDGYMLSSFICAMNQLVLDEITELSMAPQ